MLDESMHKYEVSFGVSSGETKGKEAIIVVLTKKSAPTFNNGEAGMLSTMVLTTRITLAGVVSPCESMVLIVGVPLALMYHDKLVDQLS